MKHQTFYTYSGLVAWLFLGAQCCQAFLTSTNNNANAPVSTELFATKADQERRPWEFFRFVRQSSRFINILPKKTTKRTIQPGDVLWNPVGVNKDFDFAPLDDVVMGGASSSTFDGATGKWKGEVTDANSGGFIGIRSTPIVDFDMSRCEGIEIRLKSNSKLKLKVVIRDSTEFNGIAWTSSKDVNNRSIRVPFKSQVPTMYAKIVDSDPFQKDTVKSIQLVYSKFEYDGALNPTFSTGDFDVQLEEIRAY
eukprot:scaffold1233_cov111-Cylindrotheca_fusiformis.AAC.3